MSSFTPKPPQEHRSASTQRTSELLDPGFTPRTRDVPALLNAFAESGDKHILKALVRKPREATQALLGCYLDASALAKSRWLRLAGRLTRAQPSPDLQALVLNALTDPHATVRKNAAITAGKLGMRESAEALVAALNIESNADVKNELYLALAKSEQTDVIEAVALEPTDALPRARAKARLIKQRVLTRHEPSSFEASSPIANRLHVDVRCRGGIERFLCEELDPKTHPKVVSDGITGTRIALTLHPGSTALRTVMNARTMLNFSFPLRAQSTTPPSGLATAVVRALTSDEAASLLQHFTRGVVRYRIDWAQGGKRRAVLYEIARRVAAARPWMVNDTTQATWQARVYENHERAIVELVPRFDDTRFAYRQSDVPAASHPTLAAALVRAARVREGDIVWDPFVGSGLELCECATAGRYGQLAGSDSDPRALQAARANLEAAHAKGFELWEQDALEPPRHSIRPTLILTNPPMGRRVERSAQLKETLAKFVQSAAGALQKSGRLVWLSPFPHITRQAAAKCGMTLRLAQAVDMGGFEAELQVLVKLA